MALLYQTLELAARGDGWSAALGLRPTWCTPGWFHDVQAVALQRYRSPTTVAACLAHVLWIAQCLVDDHITPAVLHDAIREVMRRRPVVHAAQRLRRLYAAANLACFFRVTMSHENHWHETHGGAKSPPLAEPLVATPRAMVSSSPKTGGDVAGRQFTPDEVDRLCAAADALSPRHGCLVRLLFTTGVRIGAVPRLRWRHLLADGTDRSRIRTTAVVLEKGGLPRVLVLEAGLRERLARLWHDDNERHDEDAFVFGRPPSRRLPLGVRQLRHWWYVACDRASLSGTHCHPHSARPQGVVDNKK